MLFLVRRNVVCGLCYTLNVELIIYGEVDMLNLYTRRADTSCSALQTEDSVIFERYFTKLNPEHCMMIASGSKQADFKKNALNAVH